MNESYFEDAHGVKLKNVGAVFAPNIPILPRKSYKEGIKNGNRLTDQSIDPSINQSINPSINQSINQSIEHSRYQHFYLFRYVAPEVPVLVQRRQKRRNNQPKKPPNDGYSATLCKAIYQIIMTYRFAATKSVMVEAATRNALVSINCGKANMKTWNKRNISDVFCFELSYQNVVQIRRTSVV